MRYESFTTYSEHAILILLGLGTSSEKQHKEGTGKVSGRSVVFSAFYANFCLCPKLVIITTLSYAIRKIG